MKLSSQLSSHLFSPSMASPTERFLRSSPMPEAVRAALEGGWLDSAHLMSTSWDNPVPALAEWASNDKFRVHSSLSVTGWQWPREPGDEHEVDWEVFAGNGAHTAAGLQAEWITGWCVSQLPAGYLPTWQPINPHVASAGFKCHLLGVAVQNNWVSVAKQILERSDRLPVSQWNTIVSPTSMYVVSSGRQTKEFQQIPLLHVAIVNKNMEMVQCLLEAGLDPNQVDSNGLPALYQCSHVEMVELLLEHGLDPSRRPTHNEGLMEWWAQRFGSSEAASRLVAPINRWLQSNQTPEQVQQERLPDVGRLLLNGTLSALKKEVSQLRLPADASWEEDGQTWTLARRALGYFLERSPVVANTKATLDFGLARGALGEPLLQGASNNTLLWLVADYSRAAEKRLGKEHTEFLPSAEEVRALAKALMTWDPPKPKSLSELRPAITKERLEWAWALGTKAAFRLPDFVDLPLEKNPAVELWDFVKGHPGYIIQPELITYSLGLGLSKAKALREIGQWEEAGKWLAQSVLMLDAMRLSDILNRKPLAQALADPNNTSPAVLVVQALEEFCAQGVGVGTDDQAKHVARFLAKFDDNPDIALLGSYWRQARMNSEWEAGAVTRRPRM